MSQLQLIDACQIEQAQAVLQWLESSTNKTDRFTTPYRFHSDAVTRCAREAMREAESKLADHVMREYREGKA